MFEVLRRLHPTADTRRSRRGYLDWVRGIAVVIMIEAHVIDSWTAVPDRFTQKFAWAMVLGGFGAPLFLLLAGVSVSLSAGSKFRRTNDVRAASLAVIRRGLQIFLLAFVFRVQAWILGWASAWTLLRVDILNIMGPAIVVSAALWGARSTPRGRASARRTGLTSFPLLPWAGFVFAGALLGVLLDAVRPGSPARSSSAFSEEDRLNLAFGVGGTILALAAYAASFLPTPYTRSDFWTSSPSFFFLRLGLLTMMAQVQAKGFREDIGRRILCFSLFWHALDIIWVALFTVVYLLGTMP